MQSIRISLSVVTVDDTFVCFFVLLRQLVLLSGIVVIAKAIHVSHAGALSYLSPQEWGRRKPGLISDLVDRTSRRLCRRVTVCEAHCITWLT